MQGWNDSSCYLCTYASIQIQSKATLKSGAVMIAQ